MKLMNKNSMAGFSLVELMVVVAIIGILASVAIPNYQRFQRTARQGEAQTHLSGIFMAEKAHHAVWSQYYGDLREINYLADGNLRYDAGLPGNGPTIPTPGNTNADYPQGYPRTAFADVNRLSQQCVTHNKNCKAQSQALPATAAAPVTCTGGGACTFVAGAAGDIGGAAPDQWTIDQAKVLLNTQSGVN